MDRIFKNNTVMGIVAVTTLLFTILIYMKTGESDNKN